MKCECNIFFVISDFVSKVFCSIFVFVVMMFLGTTSVLADYYRTDSFSTYGDFSAGSTIWMNSSLMVQDINGIETPIMNSTYNVGKWNLGLTNDEGYTVGWAKNSSPVPWEKGWLMGQYSGVAVYGLTDGEKPTHAYLVYDSTSNGWDIDLETGIVGSARDLLDGDLFFDEMDIRFGPDKILGDVSLLPPYLAASSDWPILPEMVVVLFPEPVTVFNDLFALSENWLRGDCNESNSHCDGADWGKDGKVDFLDFAKLASKWLIEPDITWVPINDSGAGMKDNNGNPINEGGFNCLATNYSQPKTKTPIQ